MTQYGTIGAKYSQNNKRGAQSADLSRSGISSSHRCVVSLPKTIWGWEAELDRRAAESRWRSAGLLIAAGLCAVIFLVFAIVNFLAGHAPTGWFALAGLPFAGATMIGCRKGPWMARWAPYPLIGYLCVMLIATLHVWNGFQGSALMWFSVIPSLAIFALGARGGLAVSILMFVVLITGFAAADHILTDAYAVRFACAYLLITAVTFAFERNRERAMARIADARDRIQMLEGMLRMCGWCHRRMRDADGNWVSTEEFFQDSAQVTFSHGICPSCEIELTGTTRTLEPDEAFR